MGKKCYRLCILALSI